MVLRVKQVERVRVAANSAAVCPSGEALTLGLSSSARGKGSKVVAHVVGDNVVQLIRLANCEH